MGSYHDEDKCAEEPYDRPIGRLETASENIRRNTPRFLQVDKRIAEITNEIEYMTKMLDSKKTYLKQLEAVRKIVKPADEAKIQALISAGLL